jgi:phosphatidylglycerophosphate synthase
MVRLMGSYLPKLCMPCFVLFSPISRAASMRSHSKAPNRLTASRFILIGLAIVFGIVTVVFLMMIHDMQEQGEQATVSSSPCFYAEDPILSPWLWLMV